MQQELSKLKNVERKTHIATIEATSSGLATAARSFNSSASFALQIEIKTQNHNHGQLINSILYNVCLFP